MDYIWNENYPIAIHVTEGEYTPEQLQYIANTDQLVVRDLRAVPYPKLPATLAGGRVDYHPESF
jgi:hypothetical protein